MAMEILRVVEEAHDTPVSSIAYNRVLKELYSSADGDKVIRVWDAKTGALLRTQQGHKGAITCLAYSSTCKLLFSASIDNTIGIWTDKGVNLQMAPMGGPVFSLAWDSKHRYLAVGGKAVVQLYKVDLLEVRKTTHQQRSVASGLKDTTVLDAPQILKRMHPPFKGPELCHTDVVSCMVITDTGKIITGGYDKCLCMYEYDKLDKPKDAFQRIRKCHTAAIVSMAYDTYNNVLITGSIDGSMKVWSMEGRLLDKFENINDQPVAVAYVPSTNMYWASGRFGRLVAYDPRAPANVTEYIKESNGLNRYKVDYMYAPMGTDMLLGATRQRQLIMWQYNHQGAYRIFNKHEEWVEAVIVVTPQLEAGDEDADAVDEIFSCGADGKVLRWQLDVEQNCDVYQCIEEWQLHEKNIYCMVFSHPLQCLITGSEDATIHLHYLSGVVPTYNDVPLPVDFTGHDARVTGLALLKNSMLASISFDKTLRIWDLSTMKPVSCMYNAHDTPLQCLEYCEERDELATCAMGNRVKVWDVKRPTQIRQVLMLDHADGPDGGADDLASPSGRALKTNMTWLTKSDIAGLPTASGIVLETIQQANRDVPEVTQVRWVPFRHCWVTAADDDTIRLWDPDGHKLHQFTYTGSSVQSLYVDSVNRLLVAAMLNKVVFVYDLDDPMPLARYMGHSDVVRSISYVKDCDAYITASWDKSLRLWFRPKERKAMQAQTGGSAAQAAGEPNLLLLEYDENGEDHFVSEYEKAHPLEMPKALSDINPMKLLQGMGVYDDDEPGGGKKKGRRGHKTVEMDLGLEAPMQDTPGTLGAKLEDLGRNLLHELNTIAHKQSAARAAGAAGGAEEVERMSTRSSMSPSMATGRNGVAARVTTGTAARLGGGLTLRGTTSSK